jgi:uncharacterized membrane protein YhaH (DUF805 family)
VRRLRLNGLPHWFELYFLVLVVLVWTEVVGIVGFLVLALIGAYTRVRVGP